MCSLLQKHTQHVNGNKADPMTGRAICIGMSVSSLALWCALPSHADAQSAAPVGQSSPTTSVPEDNVLRIVVIGNRTIVTSLKDVKVEHTYNADAAASYAVSTVGELLTQVTRENGDTAPSILVNGQPVSDLGDITDFPVEAIARIEALPLGSAAQIGGIAGQRAYNIVLRPSVRSLTTTASTQISSDGGWQNDKGEVLFTLVQGQDRINLTLRRARSGMLLESERDLISLIEFIPFSAPGNLIGQSGGELDPAFSALAGQLTSSVALASTVTSRPSLTDLLPGANRLNPSNLNQFRTLRGATEPYEANLAGSKKLAPWLSLSFNGRLNWSETTSLNGLPTARVLIPSTNGFTPFARSTILALTDPTRPLMTATNSIGGNLSATLTANFAAWRFTTIGRIEERTRLFESTRVSGAGLVTIDNATNPFAGNLAATIATSQRRTRSKTIANQISQDVEGPIFTLPAGPARVRLDVHLLSSGQIAADATNAGDRRFRRTELASKAGVTLPLTSAASPTSFLGFLGSTELSVDIAHVDLGRFGHLDRYGATLSWQPIKWLTVNLNQSTDARPIPQELSGAPSTVTENVFYFDPLTNTSVFVTTISGGTSDLRNERQEVNALSINAQPLPKYNLLIGATYTYTDAQNQFGALPPPSSAIVLAFPERFVRNGAGILTQVDNRTINFARQTSRELRVTLGFSIPLSRPAQVAPSVSNRLARPAPPLTLQINASHLALLESKTIIRTGLERVDMLDGGAIGIGGGRPQHISDGTFALTQGGTGVRFSFSRRGRSVLRTGSMSAPDLLTFDAITKVDLRGFADLARWMPQSRLAKGARLTLAFENLGNARQNVTNSLGLVPTSFQPAYQYPIWQTFLVELRKVF
jgi:iron complex outermembrane recepter protein